MQSKLIQEQILNNKKDEYIKINFNKKIFEILFFQIQKN